MRERYRERERKIQREKQREIHTHREREREDAVSFVVTEKSICTHTYLPRHVVSSMMLPLLALV